MDLPGTTDAPQQALMGGMSSLQISEEYSDLIIVCGDNEFKVHRAIICPRSSFFNTACKGDFKEAITGRVELKEDDPAVIKKVIDYMYTLDYEDGSRVGSDHRAVFGNAKQGVYAIRLAISVNAAADKYDVKGLKELTCQKFGQILRGIRWGDWKVDDFVTVMQEVSEKTRPKDTMRGMAKAKAGRNLDKLMANASFCAFLGKEPELAIDLLRDCSKFASEDNCRNPDCSATRTARVAVDGCHSCTDKAYGIGVYDDEGIQLPGDWDNGWGSANSPSAHRNNYWIIVTPGDPRTWG